MLKSLVISTALVLLMAVNPTSAGDFSPLLARDRSDLGEHIEGVNKKEVPPTPPKDGDNGDAPKEPKEEVPLEHLKYLP